jgi:hypothetical protein
MGIVIESLVGHSIGYIGRMLDSFVLKTLFMVHSRVKQSDILPAVSTSRYGFLGISAF